MQLSISTVNTLHERHTSDTKMLSIFGIVLLFVSFLHHAFFCFINTHFFTVSTSALVLTELSLLALTSFFFIRNVEISFLIILIFIFANAFILAVFQEGFDPKNIRNFMIPVLLIWLGSRYDNEISIDTIFKWLAWIFIVFGLFELLFIDLFQQIFNVLNFQISVGRTTEKATEYTVGSFSLNGTRYSGRNFFSFLGDHRVASVFLETVNTSNFCTLLAAWGLSKKTLKEAWQFYAIGLIVAVLADSRFGVSLIMLMTILRFTFTLNLLKIISYFMPIFVLSVCIYLGWDMVEFRDDFETRLGSTGADILQFKMSEFFGLSNNHYKAFVDQGYARLLHFNGAILVVILWISFLRLSVNAEGQRFKALVAVIISANLAISGDSIFAFKWVAIMWFLLGTTMITNKRVKS